MVLPSQTDKMEEETVAGCGGDGGSSDDILRT